MPVRMLTDESIYMIEQYTTEMYYMHVYVWMWNTVIFVLNQQSLKKYIIPFSSQMKTGSQLSSSSC